MSNYVSLMPADYRQKLLDEAKQRKMLFVTTVVAAGVAALLVIVIIIRLVMVMGIYNTQKEIDQINGQIAGYAELEELQRQMETLQGKVQGVQALDPQWLDALYQFGQALPQGVWAKSMACATTETGTRTLAVECGGVIYNDISQTLLALQACPVVEAVQCSSSTQSPAAVGGAASSVSFTLNVTLKGK